MAIYYKDTTNKYDLSDFALREAAQTKGLFTELASIVVWPIMAFESIMISTGKLISNSQQNKNRQQKNKYGYLADSDKAAYDSENNTYQIILIICAIVAFLFFTKNEK